MTKSSYETGKSQAKLIIEGTRMKKEAFVAHGQLLAREGYKSSRARERFIYGWNEIAGEHYSRIAIAEQDRLKAEIIAEAKAGPHTDELQSLDIQPALCIECEQPARHHIPVGDEELTVALCDQHYVSFSEAQYQISQSRLEGDWQVTRPNSDEWAICQLVGNEWEFVQYVSDLAWFDGWVKQGICKIRPSEFGDGACGAWRKLGKSEAAILGFNLPESTASDKASQAAEQVVDSFSDEDDFGEREQLIQELLASMPILAE